MTDHDPSTCPSCRGPADDDRLDRGETLVLYLTGLAVVILAITFVLI